MIITIAKHVVYTIINAYLGREHRTRVDFSKHLLQCPDLHYQSSEGSTPQIVQKPCKLVVRCITDKSINFTSYTLLSTCAILKNFNSIQWNVYQFSIFQKNILFPFITFIIKQNKISILKKKGLLTSSPTNQNDSTVYQMNRIQDQRCLLTAQVYWYLLII